MMARPLPPIGAMVRTESGRVGRVVEHHERMNWVWVSIGNWNSLEKGKVTQLYPWIKNWDATPAHAGNCAQPSGEALNKARLTLGVSR